MQIVPDDDRDFAYPVSCIRVGRGGTLKVRLFDDRRSVETWTVFAGQIINRPVLRVFDTGTTAAGLATDLLAPSESDEAVPLAAVADDGETYTPSLDYSDSRNSQYLGMGF